MEKGVENGEILLVKMLVGVENGEWEKVRNGRRGCRSCRSRLFGRSSVANKRSAASGDSGSYSLILTFFYSFQGAAAGPEKRTKEQFRTSRRPSGRSEAHPPNGLQANACRVEGEPSDARLLPYLFPRTRVRARF